MHYFLSLITIILLTKTAYTQEYISPVNTNILLSGTFGELRNNHFHAGIDIKTNGIEGKKIYAIADGYISRIKVSSQGYGKAIYINHNDGNTSVYAHLQKFSKKIDTVVKQHHYKTKKFEINYYPKKNDIPIQKGELIAFSGNSGSSQGPHLHFEIRNTKTQKPINPLSLGFNIHDNISPEITHIKIYSINNTLINQKETDQIFKLKKTKDTYLLKDTPIINGKFGIGISTYDKMNNSNNKNGIYSILIYVDSILSYKFIADILDFKTTRYINSHIDYKEKIINKKKYHKCFKLPNNKLTNYKKLINNGFIHFTDNKLHFIKIVVSDIYGNNSVVNLKIQSENTKIKPLKKKEASSITKQFFFNKANIFKTKNIEIHMPKYSLYESLLFKYKKSDSIPGIFGNIHECHTDDTPVHKKYVLSIKADIPKKLRNKVYIAKIDKKNQFKYLGGIWKNGFVKSKIREFGEFCIIADTINPKIIPINIFNGKNINNQNTIQINIKDTQSGIKEYIAEIDNKWVLMEFDYKKDLLIFNIDKTLTTGEHAFKLTVIDNVGNSTTYTTNFMY